MGVSRDVHAPWCDALREHVAHIARGCRSGLSHNPAVHEQAIEAAHSEATQERQALLDIADAAHDAVVVNGWDEPRESITVTNPELKRLADAVLAFPARAEDSQSRGVG